MAAYALQERLAAVDVEAVLAELVARQVLRRGKFVLEEPVLREELAGRIGFWIISFFFSELLVNLQPSQIQNPQG